jgi:predicted outer membrane repeat protein
MAFDADSLVETGLAQRGGGIYVKAGIVDIFGNVEDNDAVGGDARGGGLYVLAGDIDLDGGFVSGNHADKDGGGVFLAVGTTRFDVDNSDFETNTSGEDGAGLYTLAVDPDFDVAHFDANTATGNGGGLYMASGALTANHLDLTGNDATSLVADPNFANSAGSQATDFKLTGASAMFTGGASDSYPTSGGIILPRRKGSR